MELSPSNCYNPIRPFAADGHTPAMVLINGMEQYHKSFPVKKYRYYKAKSIILCSLEL